MASWKHNPILQRDSDTHACALPFPPCLCLALDLCLNSLSALTTDGVLIKSSRNITVSKQRSACQLHNCRVLIQPLTCSIQTGREPTVLAPPAAACAPAAVLCSAASRPGVSTGGHHRAGRLPARHTARPWGAQAPKADPHPRHTRRESCGPACSCRDGLACSTHGGQHVVVQAPDVLTLRDNRLQDELSRTQAVTPLPQNKPRPTRAGRRPWGPLA